jgi:hypothetical protein
MKCPKCGKNEKHFVPPSLGEDGFYLCETNPTPTPAKPGELEYEDMDAEHLPHVSQEAHRKMMHAIGGRVDTETRNYYNAGEPDSDWEDLVSGRYATKWDRGEELGGWYYALTEAGLSFLHGCAWNTRTPAQNTRTPAQPTGAILDQSKFEIGKPPKHLWVCHCGAATIFNTDETLCRCGDLYDEEWHLFEPSQPVPADTVLVKRADLLELINAVPSKGGLYGLKFKLLQQLKGEG